MILDGRDWQTSAGLTVAVAFAVGCGSAGPGKALGKDFERAQEVGAHERAPELWAAARKARERAQQARAKEHPQTAADFTTESRLWLAAALAQTESERFEARRLQLEARTRAALRQARRDEQARDQIARSIQRLKAARVAMEQAQKAFAEAEVDEGRRYDSLNAAEHEKAVAVLAKRTVLLAASAQALGARAAAAQQLQQQAQHLVEQPVGEDSLNEAHALLLRSHRLLGEARLKHEQPTQDQRQSLIGLAQEMGFEVEQQPRGARIEVGNLFRGRSARLSRRGRARLERIAMLLSSHPHGPVEVQAEADGRPRLASARYHALIQQLSALDVQTDRLVEPPSTTPIGGAQDPATVLTFFAYGPSTRSE